MRESTINTGMHAIMAPASSLLKASVPDSSVMLSQYKQTTTEKNNDAEHLLRTLINLGFNSIFDITRPSRSRFVKRHGLQLRGRAGEIYDRAASFTSQVVQHYRKNKSRNQASKNSLTAVDDGMAGQTLPSYTDLFPESWLDFCREDAIESVDSPVSYLVDLYRFVQQIELDASGNAVTLKKRRPDILQLPLNNDTTYQEMSELELVNHILMTSIQNSEGIQRQEVYAQLDLTRFPYALPYSFAAHQIHLGLMVKDCSLSQVVKNDESHKALPWEETPAQRNSVLLAASRLSVAENTLLTEDAVCATYQVNADQLHEGYLSGSTTEILPNADLRKHGYIVPSQTDVSGATELGLTFILDNTLSPNYDNVTVTCTNATERGKYTHLSAYESTNG
jgi:hypothetical protein